MKNKEGIVLTFCPYCKNKQQFTYRGTWKKKYRTCIYCNRQISLEKNIVAILK